MWEVDSEANLRSILVNSSQYSVNHVLISVNHVLNSVKHVLNSVKHAQIQGSCRPLMPHGPHMPHGPQYTTVFYTPRFSYDVLKLTVLGHVLGMTVVRRTGVQGGYGTGVGSTGWVYRGVLPSHFARGEQASDSEAGPGSPSMGLEWVV